MNFLQGLYLNIVELTKFYLVKVKSRRFFLELIVNAKKLIEKKKYNVQSTKSLELKSYAKRDS